MPANIGNASRPIVSLTHGVAWEAGKRYTAKWSAIIAAMASHCPMAVQSRESSRSALSDASGASMDTERPERGATYGRWVPACQPGHELLGRHRRRIEVALPLLCSGLPQVGMLRIVFDAFGNDFVAKVVGEIDDGFYQAAPGGAGKIIDEQLVDLDGVHWEVLEI